MSGTWFNPQDEALRGVLDAIASSRCERCRKERPAFLPRLRGWRKLSSFWLCRSCWATTHSTPTAWYEYLSQRSQNQGALREAVVGLVESPTASTPQNPVCPNCGTVYNRTAVIREIKKLAPAMFLFAIWTMTFICTECGEKIAITGTRDES